MKLLLAIFLVLMPSLSFSQTQAEMNDEAYKDYQKADRELNAAYSKILREYKADTAFIRSLKAAQRLWVQWRDAEIKAIFPAEQPKFAYGSVFPMCYSMQLAALTRERTNKLKVWINGIEEGDVCSGSVRVK